MNHPQKRGPNPSWGSGSSTPRNPGPAARAASSYTGNGVVKQEPGPPRGMVFPRSKPQRRLYFAGAVGVAHDAAASSSTSIARYQAPPMQRTAQAAALDLYDTLKVC